MIVSPSLRLLPLIGRHLPLAQRLGNKVLKEARLEYENAKPFIKQLPVKVAVQATNGGGVSTIAYGVGAYALSAAVLGPASYIPAAIVGLSMPVFNLGLRTARQAIAKKSPVLAMEFFKAEARWFLARRPAWMTRPTKAFVDFCDKNLDPEFSLRQLAGLKFRLLKKEVGYLFRLFECINLKQRDHCEKADLMCFVRSFQHGNFVSVNTDSAAKLVAYFEGQITKYEDLFDRVKSTEALSPEYFQKFQEVEEPWLLRIYKELISYFVKPKTGDSACLHTPLVENALGPNVYREMISLIVSFDLSSKEELVNWLKAHIQELQVLKSQAVEYHTQLQEIHSQISALHEDALKIPGW